MDYVFMTRFAAANKEDAMLKWQLSRKALADAGIGPVQVDEPRLDLPRTVIHTDGGCDIKKDGLGAYAFIVTYLDGTEYSHVEAVMGTTNNRMELTAVIEALKHVEIGPPIQVISDSEYVVKGITSWCRNWVRNGWVNASGKPVINRDLWEILIALYQVHDVTFTHIRGHQGDVMNERVDQMCTAAMQQLHRAVLASAQK